MSHFLSIVGTRHLRTAKALGLDLPASVLARADYVIDLKWRDVGYWHKADIQEPLAKFTLGGLVLSSGNQRLNQGAS